MIVERICARCGTPFQVQNWLKRRHCSKFCGDHSSKNKRHGMIHSAEYMAWRDMKSRCRNPKHKDYPKYAGRGISVCARWLESFENFYADMGPKPDKGYSIERTDNDGNYEPGNCKWATSLEQNRNRRGLWTADENNSLKELAERGLSFPEIARAMGKSLGATQGHAYRIGVKSGRPPTRPDFASQIAQHHQGTENV